VDGQERLKQDRRDHVVLGVVQALWQPADPEAKEVWRRGAGARWDDVVAACPYRLEVVEATLERLMDRGLVYEPTLGIFVPTLKRGAWP
jgi:hypothetical protein